MVPSGFDVRMQRPAEPFATNALVPLKVRSTTAPAFDAAGIEVAPAAAVLGQMVAADKVPPGLATDPPPHAASATTSAAVSETKAVARLAVDARDPFTRRPPCPSCARACRGWWADRHRSSASCGRPRTGTLPRNPRTTDLRAAGASRRGPASGPTRVAIR